MLPHSQLVDDSTRASDREILTASVRQALSASRDLVVVRSSSTEAVDVELNKITHQLMAMIDAYVERAVR